jgi:hypothetical protein
MHYMYEQLIYEHIRELRDEIAVERRARRARRERRPSPVVRFGRRISQITHRPTLVGTAPAHALDTSTSST